MSEKYKDKVANLSALDKGQINKLYKAVLKAAQYDAFQYNGKAFHLLEGTVHKDSKGQYIFTPNKHLQAMLDSADYPALLKIEESRFLDLIKAALQELKE